MAEEQLNIVLVISVLRWSFVVCWSDISAKFWSDRLWIVPLSWGKSFIKDGDLFAPGLIANMLTMMITLITFSIFDFFFFLQNGRREENILRDIFLKEILHVDSLSDWRGFIVAILLSLLRSWIMICFRQWVFVSALKWLVLRGHQILGFSVLGSGCWCDGADFLSFCWRESTVLSIFRFGTGW